VPVVPGNDSAPLPCCGRPNLGVVDSNAIRTEVRDFLASRRARITPEQAGLPVFGGRRRVKGLRREELAMLAGVSVDYYTRLERGNLSGASDGVLDAIARALRLDEAETRHLFDLARATGPAPARARQRPAQPTVRASVQAMLDAMTGAPAAVRNDRLDILATNPLGRALYSELYRDPVRPANHARFAFLDPRARDFWVDWERAADDTVGILRTAAGRNPYDQALTALVGELSTRSEEFRTRWAIHHVHLHLGGAKLIDHPVVGRLELMYDTLELPADAGLTMLVYTAEPTSPTADALTLLASWAATEAPRSAPADRP
jgi:transcriptional regulator with XRE-family HTH domain